MKIFPDRVQGGTSYKPGQIELMIERKINGEDGKGIPEILNDGYNLTLNYYLLLQINEKKNENEKKYQIFDEKEPLIYTVNADRYFTAVDENLILGPSIVMKDLRKKLECLRIDVENKKKLVFGLRVVNYGDEEIEVDFEYLLVSQNFNVMNVATVVEKSLEGYWDKGSEELR